MRTRLTRRAQFDTSKADGQFRKPASNKRLVSLIGPDFRFTPFEQGESWYFVWGVFLSASHVWRSEYRVAEELNFRSKHPTFGPCIGEDMVWCRAPV